MERYMWAAHDGMERHDDGAWIKYADHRREVETVRAALKQVSLDLQAAWRHEADLQRQLEAERDVQHALTDIIAEERAKLEAARATAQRAPLESETVCHACDGSGWVERGW